MKKVIWFIVAVCIISWCYAAGFYLAGFKYSGTSMLIFGASYMMLPMIVTLIIQKLFLKEEVIKPLLISFKLNKWFVAAMLIAPVLSVISVFVAMMIPGVSYSPGMEGIIERLSATVPPEKMAEMKQTIAKVPAILMVLSTFVQGVVLGSTVNVLATFGEELGWRGMMLTGLKKWKFLPASLIIGAVWGIWHFPLILMGHNYPQHNIFGVFMMTGFCGLLSPLFCYITIKARSVIAAAVMHGTLNGTAGISLMVLKGGNDLLIGMPGLAGMITILVAVIIVFIADRYYFRENIFTKRIEESLAVTNTAIS